MLPYVFLGITTAAAGVGLVLWRARKSEPVRLYTIRCRRCGQKLRYGEDKEGRTITCPRCLRACTLRQSQLPL